LAKHLKEVLLMCNMSRHRHLNRLLMSRHLNRLPMSRHRHLNRLLMSRHLNQRLLAKHPRRFS
jgi:hypothetical protein